jgi:hypothetical protein
MQIINELPEFSIENYAPLLLALLQPFGRRTATYYTRISILLLHYKFQIKNNYQHYFSF